MWALPALVSQDGNGRKQAECGNGLPRTDDGCFSVLRWNGYTRVAGRSWNIAKHNLVNPRPLARADVVCEETIYRDRVSKSQTFQRPRIPDLPASTSNSGITGMNGYVRFVHCRDLNLGSPACLANETISSVPRKTRKCTR